MVHGRDAQAFRLNDPEVWSPWFSVSNEVEQARRVRAAIRGDTDYDDGSGSDADAYGGSSVGNVARQRGGRAGRSGGLCALMLMRPLSAGSRLRGPGSAHTRGASPAPGGDEKERGVRRARRPTSAPGRDRPRMNSERLMARDSASAAGPELGPVDRLSATDGRVASSRCAAPEHRGRRRRRVPPVADERFCGWSTADLELDITSDDDGYGRPPRLQLPRRPPPSGESQSGLAIGGDSPSDSSLESDAVADLRQKPAVVAVARTPPEQQRNQQRRRPSGRVPSVHRGAVRAAAATPGPVAAASTLRQLHGDGGKTPGPLPTVTDAAVTVTVASATPARAMTTPLARGARTACSEVPEAATTRALAADTAAEERESDAVAPGPAAAALARPATSGRNARRRPLHTVRPPMSAPRHRDQCQSPLLARSMTATRVVIGAELDGPPDPARVLFTAAAARRRLHVGRCIRSQSARIAAAAPTRAESDTAVARAPARVSQTRPLAESVEFLRLALAPAPGPLSRCVLEDRAPPAAAAAAAAAAGIIAAAVTVGASLNAAATALAAASGRAARVPMGSAGSSVGPTVTDSAPLPCQDAVSITKVWSRLQNRRPQRLGDAYIAAGSRATAASRRSALPQLQPMGPSVALRPSFATTAVAFGQPLDVSRKQRQLLLVQQQRPVVADLAFCGADAWLPGASTVAGPSAGAAAASDGESAVVPHGQARRGSGGLGDPRRRRHPR